MSYCFWPKKNEVLFHSFWDFAFLYRLATRLFCNTFPSQLGEKLSKGQDFFIFTFLIVLLNVQQFPNTSFEISSHIVWASASLLHTWKVASLQVVSTCSMVTKRPCGHRGTPGSGQDSELPQPSLQCCKHACFACCLGVWGQAGGWGSMQLQESGRMAWED